MTGILTLIGAANATVTFTAPTGGNLIRTLLPVYSSYISVNSTHGREHLAIPYLGVAASIRSKPIQQAPPGFLAGYSQAYVSKNEQRAFFQGVLADETVLPVEACQMVTSALRVFGDAVREDWDVIETVPFIIKYGDAPTATPLVKKYL